MLTAADDPTAPYTGWIETEPWLTIITVFSLACYVAAVVSFISAARVGRADWQGITPTKRAWLWINGVAFFLGGPPGTAMAAAYYYFSLRPRLRKEGKACDDGGDVTAVDSVEPQRTTMDRSFWNTSPWFFWPSVGLTAVFILGFVLVGAGPWGVRLVMGLFIVSGVGLMVAIRRSGSLEGWFGRK